MKININRIPKLSRKPYNNYIDQIQELLDCMRDSKNVAMFQYILNCINKTNKNFGNPCMGYEKIITPVLILLLLLLFI